MAGRNNYYPESQKKYKEKYFRDMVDRIHIIVPKGKKDEYKKYAEMQGKSLNQFVVDCVDDKILDIEFFRDK